MQKYTHMRIAQHTPHDIDHVTLRLPSAHIRYFSSLQELAIVVRVTDIHSKNCQLYSIELLWLFYCFISDIFLWTSCSNAMEWLLRNSCKKSAGDLLHIRAGSIPDSLPNITTTNCLICQPLPFKNVTRTTLLLWYARVVFAFLQFPIWWLTACCPTSFL